MGKKFLLLFLWVTGYVMCVAAYKAPLSAEWNLVDASEVQKYTKVQLTLTNTSRDTLYGENWCILYSLMALHPTAQDSAELSEEIVQGTLHRLSPTAFFQPLAPGQSHTYLLSYYRVYIVHDSWLPEMFAFLPLSGKRAAQPIAIPFVCQPLAKTNPKAWQFTRYMSATDSVPYATGENLYAYYRSIGDTVTAGLHLLPAPKQIVYGEGLCRIGHAQRILRKDSTLEKEGYRLELGQDRIYLYYADEAGLFYARQTLRQLVNTGQGVVPQCTITDAPEYAYRGFLLDIARNFLPKKAILSIIETMAELKLNRLQLHFSDDEAWRLEIPSYPQLTKMGAKRGYSGTVQDPLAETTRLYPQFGDQIDNRTAPGSGYLTRRDMIEILRYAKARYIQVIPEVDMPGHMRAAKVAMGSLLRDSLMDSRSYMSAQEFTDCVIDVTSPWAVPFIETVVTDIEDMYRQAGCDLPVFNIGGDEVPRGALTREEHQAFMDSVVAMLARHGLRPAGWEEMTRFCPASSDMLCVYWHHRPQLLSQLIDSGYSIVIARNDRLYMDFAYANHESEWGTNRVCDEFRIFDWFPEQGLDEEHAAKLSQWVVGCQAQLWGETLRSVPQAETYIYPKLFGFAERAWNPHSRMTKAMLKEEIYRYLLPYYARNHSVHTPLPGVHIESL